VIWGFPMIGVQATKSRKLTWAVLAAASVLAGTCALVAAALHYNPRPQASYDQRRNWLVFERFPFSDLAKMSDPSKTEQCARFELKAAEAEKLAMQKDYAGMHRAYSEAAESCSAVFGPKSEILRLMLFRQGERENEFKKWQPSIEAFSAAIAIDPNDAWEYGWRGYANLNAKHYQDAVDDFSKDIEISQNASAYCGRAHAYSGLHQYQKSIDDYTQVIRLEPNIRSTYMWRAYTYDDLKQYQIAIDDYTKSINIAPSIKAYIGLARDHGILGQYQKSVEDATRAIRLDPNVSECYQYRARAYDYLNQWQNAIADYTKAISISPDAWSYGGRAGAYQWLHQNQKSLEDDTQAIRIDPTNHEYYKTRAQTYNDLGQYQNAIVDCNRAIAINPKDAQSYCYRVCAYMQTRQYREAIDDCSKVITIDPSHPWISWIYSQRGIAHYQLGKYHEAIADSTKSMAFKTEDPIDFCNIAYSYECLGQSEKAFEALTKAIALSPKSGYYYARRGEIYREFGKNDLAKKDFVMASNFGYKFAPTKKQ
jgi:tetratricopeptide (TPR) repeat protein